jgi:hypothetical protein
MADNVGYTPGTGATVAADDIAGVLHQRVKIGVGADGVAVDVSDANPMPVAGEVSVTGSVAITAAAPLEVTGTVDVTSTAPLPVTGTVAITAASPLDVVITGLTEDDPLPVHDESAHQLLTRLLILLSSPMGYDKSLQRQRGTVLVESGTVTTVSTVTTVTTVAAVTSLNNYDGYNARMTVLDQNRSAWAQCVRARIT